MMPGGVGGGQDVMDIRLAHTTDPTKGATMILVATQLVGIMNLIAFLKTEVNYEKPTQNRLLHTSKYHPCD